jgi:hypothetical protein
MATCAKHIDSTDTALNINLSLKQRSAKMKVNPTRHSAFFSLLCRLTPYRVSCRVCVSCRVRWLIVFRGPTRSQESASSVRAVVESAKYQASITQLRDKFCKYTDELVSALASLPTTTYDSHMSLLAERLRFDGA